MEKHFKKESLSEGKIILEYGGILQEDLGKKVHDLILTAGYKMIEGSAGNAVYEKGSMALRIIFGAFVKHFKFAVIVSPIEGGDMRLEIAKKTSGAAGGLVGMKQVKNEFERLSKLLQTI